MSRHFVEVRGVLTVNAMEYHDMHKEVFGALVGEFG